MSSLSQSEEESLPSSGCVLEIKELKSYYGSIQALRGVSLRVKRGQIVTLIGSNGAGKSTLLMNIFGSPPARSGQILYNNDDIRNVPTYDIAKKGIALVPEGRRIFPSMNIEENLKMGTIALGDANEEEDLEKVYGLFPRLKERRSQRAGTLSGGEQQMLAIGRGLMARPNLLLLDEPSLGLAPIIVQQIFRIIKDISQQGITIFLVEQNANHALRLADYGYVLVNGQIRLSGSGSELRANPEVKKAYLGA